MTNASQITRKAKSNLAFAFRVLPKERRRDMTAFYAFCRIIDDIADDPVLTPERKHSGLDEWHCGLSDGFSSPTPLQQEIVDLRNRHGIPNELLLAIIDGCRSDIEPRRFQTYAELDHYIWQVACAVGLVSVRLFGCETAQSRAHAEAMGRALQITNILRDIAEDWENGHRLYLPLDEMRRFGYSEDQLAKQNRNQAFLKLMRFQTERALGFFAEAERLIPTHERRKLAPSRIMGAIYQTLLETMRDDGFQVFHSRYRLGIARKSAILLRHWLSG